MDPELENYMKTGDQLLGKGKNIDSIREYLKGYEMLKDKENQDTADFCQRLSTVYSLLGKEGYEEAKKFGEISLHIHEKIDDQDLVVLDLLSLASAVSSAGKNQEAEAFANRALDLSKKMNDPVFIAMSLNSLGSLKMDSKKSKNEALKIFDEVIALSKENEDWDDYFEALTNKISIISEDKDADEALRLGNSAMDQADDIAKKIKNKRDRKNFRESIIFLYDVLADIAMSMENVDLAIKIAQRSKSD
ncbi:MAG: hypothetical protein LVQ96_05960 [Thermoplasmatales archaeon]|nr:hypothetical protein [Thermoplasmatales archaeon]MCW6170699.1 hypothetical protein [Thermoplasmatales archaeon]